MSIDAYGLKFRVDLLDEVGGEITFDVIFRLPVGDTIAPHWQAIREAAKAELRTIPGNDDLAYDTMWVVSITNFTTGEIFQPEHGDQPEYDVVDPSQSHMRID